MEIFIIAVLIITAIVIFLLELFVIPGLSLAGFAAVGCMLYANYYAFTRLGMTGGLVTLAVSVIAGVGSIVWFMRSKTLDKLALKKEDRKSTRLNSSHANISYAVFCLK